MGTGACAHGYIAMCCICVPARLLHPFMWFCAGTYAEYGGRGV